MKTNITMLKLMIKGQANNIRLL